MSTLASTKLCVVGDGIDICAAYNDEAIKAYGQGYVTFIAVMGILITSALLLSNFFNLVEFFSGLPWKFFVRTKLCLNFLNLGSVPYPSK